MIPLFSNEENFVVTVFRLDLNATDFSEVWARHLMRWDAEHRLEGRSICLLVDNAPGLSNIKLTNIHLVFMPKKCKKATEGGILLPILDGHS